MDIDASQLRAFGVDLGKTGVRTTLLATRAIAKTAYDIEADAKSLCPVDTGALKNSIYTSVRGLSAEVGPTMAYAGYVEEGTSRMAPQPYLGPAFDRRAPGLEQALEQIVDHLL